MLELRSSHQLSTYQIAAALDREGLPASVSSIAAILRRAQREPASNNRRADAVTRWGGKGEVCA